MSRIQTSKPQSDHLHPKKDGIQAQERQKTMSMTLIPSHNQNTHCLSMIEQGARRYGDHEHELEFPATIRPLTAYER